MKRCLIILIALICSIPTARAGMKVSRTSDIVYDHRDGLALVFDVIRPEKQNGAAILNIISGSWVSRAASTQSTESYKEYTDRGFTVFVVTHVSQPRYNVREIIGQFQRAIRFIRYHAAEYGIDPDRLGATGASAGGHLSISAAVYGEDAQTEEEYRARHGLDEKVSIDPIELQSSKIQCVACFYPPTNFVNYIDLHTNWFDFPTVRNVSPNGSFIETPDSPRDKQDEALRSISPYFEVDADTPPILIIHGTADELVPFSQSVSFVAKLMSLGLPYRFIPREGKGHGWEWDPQDDQEMCDWFEKWLSK